MSRRISRRGTPAYGQHFLHDGNLLRTIVDAAELDSGSHVLEIGVGTGNLTRIILETGAQVVGVEVDRSLESRIEDQFGTNPSFRLVRGDILRIPWSDLLPREDKAVVMGNLPYAVSSQVLFKVLQWRERVARVVFLVQWEVGARLAADRGGKDYGILSVACQLYGKPTILRKIPPGVFTPPPRVDSALVRWDVRSSPITPVDDRDFTMEVIRAAFAQRRKKLVNSLAARLKDWDKDALQKVCGVLGIPENTRAEQLSVEQFAQLANSLFRHTKGEKRVKNEEARG
ncbi:MAG: ribosomal RNA small subunit methyltransferase A [bacterium]|nr:MAG: ribosomal RNA small subunit methyltransferase A [bacterium]